MPHCPQCLRAFQVSGGFCPYDGATLRAGDAPLPRIEGFDDQHGEQAALARLRQHGAIADHDDNLDRILGTQLDGRYKVTRKLGEGGMGVVFFARHVVLDKPVAIKVLKGLISRDPSAVKRFVQEARAASRIGHPNIIDVTDFGETDDGLTYQVMEFIEGQTLAQLIDSQAPMPIRDCLPIVGQIARALDAAHNKGIVHRDLKPDNVFLINRHGRHDFVKIVDFGIAKVHESSDKKNTGPRLTRAGSVFGTPEYMAPEQASGQPDIDRRADIYSLGCMLYEMLTGKVPLQGETTVRTVAMQILDTVVPPRTARPDILLSAAFEKVLMKTLAKERTNRHASMAELISDLEQAGGGSLLEPFTNVVQAVTLPAAPPPSGPVTAVEPVVDDDTTSVEQRGAASTDHDKETKPYPHLDTVTPADSVNQLRATDPAGLPADAKNDLAAADKPAAKNRRTRDRTYDPPFVQAGRPAFDLADETPLRPYRKKKNSWAVIAVVLTAAGVGVGTMFLVRKPAARARTAADAAPLAAVSVDAAPLAAVSVDAAPLAAGTIVDAAPVAVTAKPDARVRKPRVLVPKTEVDPLPKKDVTVRIITEPEGGDIFIKGAYAGPDRTHMTRSSGTTVNVTCKLTGYFPGKAAIRFDGKQKLVTCIMKPKCVPGIKTPFADCPD